MHPWLAFVCFFRLLFGRSLPAAAAQFLPAPDKALPPAAGAKPAPDRAADAREVRREEKPKDERPKDDKPRASAAQQQREAVFAFLALLQREARFIDFVRDSVDGASDGDVGAAAREVHRGCRKVIDQCLALEPVMPGAEEEKVAVPKGFDPAEVRLIGEAKGEPPYRGTLRHHGWRVVDAKLPTLAEGVDRTVIAPAEVELA
jgi:hypothetical protein